MIDNKIREKWTHLKSNVEDLQKHVNIDIWQSEIKDIEKQMESPDFWNNNEKATKLNRKLKILKNRVKTYLSIMDEIGNINEFVDIAEENSQREIEELIDNLTIITNDFQTELLFTDELDENDAILTIHPGAGGTDACDWADMLYRMYIKFFQKRGFNYSVMDYEADDIAGIKNVTINISGEYAYGYLKCEIGVHRLVRISPFNSKKKRETSFAAVYVYPDIDKDIDFELDEKDLKIEAFRSSGPGGQNVNKLSTAIRITHIPTGIFAKSQSERSQHQNKMNAMKILKAKVYQYYKELEEEKMNKKLVEKKKNEWGNQIRSYVMYPYKMVKDLRTKYETSDVDGVLDGNLDRFIKEYLIMKARDIGGKIGK